MAKKGRQPGLYIYIDDLMNDWEVLEDVSFGIATKALLKMDRSSKRGVISDTEEKMVRVLQTTHENLAFAISEFEKYETFEVERYFSVTGNATVTLMSRRMLREEKERLQSTKRQQKYRAKHKSNGEVTTPLPIPTPFPTPGNDKPLPKKDIENLTKEEYFQEAGLQLASLLRDQILSSDPDHKPITDATVGKWANTMRLMMTSDGRDSAQVIDVMEWLYTEGVVGEFAFVVESAKAFREKYDRIKNARHRRKQEKAGGRREIVDPATGEIDRRPKPYRKGG